jgi:nucleotide-binding universal stress UspA family protein
MFYATIMVYVEADGTPRERVRLSAQLAHKFNATLIGVSARAVRPPVVPGGIAMAVPTDIGIPDIEARLVEKAKWFQLVVGADRPKLLWRPSVDFPVNALCREARSADLVVIGPIWVSGDAYGSLDPGKAILGLGRPALYVPGDVTELRAEHVVIAWKDVREARRAVQDALPLLHGAERVTIAEICESGDEERGGDRLGDVASYLARHRINSGPRVILHREGSGAAQLITLAQHEGADLLVTGAYGHSRLGEWVFGGVTRDLLAHSPICCLMSH